MAVFLALHSGVPASEWLAHPSDIATAVGILNRGGKF